MSEPRLDWPYARQDPDLVVLEPRAGHAPSTLPAVRIFLGTEEAQYRAERIFVWSIEQVRDPSRRYEIYLMKNIKGFDRRGWRTGFTKYRFAIPDFAGGRGKAIYNDVDQIYLADPANLFDLDMNGHGYLAISPEETSVMLIDCEKMLSLWNRKSASAHGKYELIKRPARTPGLWGACDPHWNARDQEYVEGLSKCLHYTHLNQQPWEPFPTDFSYHPNPLAYIWYKLERQADANGYEIFDAERPSPSYESVMGSNENHSRDTGGAPADSRAQALARRLGIRTARTVRTPASTVVDSLASSFLGPLDLRRSPLVDDADLVAVAGYFDTLPPADIGWSLAQVFEAASKLVWLRIKAQRPKGFGSPAWWRKRVATMAERYPQKSWHLEVVGASSDRTAFQVERRPLPTSPSVWVLLDGDPDRASAALELARALDWPFTVKKLVMAERSLLPGRYLGASLEGLNHGRSDSLEPPWPDLVISAGRRTAPVARWIKRSAAGVPRLVQLHGPAAEFNAFDLIVAEPQDSLPIRDNVLQTSASLAGFDEDTTARAVAAVAPSLDDFPRPWLTVFLGASGSFVLSPSRAAELGRLVARYPMLKTGSLLICASAGAGPEALRRFCDPISRPCRILRAQPGRPDDPRAAFVALGDHFVTTGDDAVLLTALCQSGKPVELFELPTVWDRAVIVRPLQTILAPIIGGGTNYRGTPFQQTIVGRLVDEGITSGRLFPVSDPKALHASLMARGLLVPVEHAKVQKGRPPATRHPLDDKSRAVERIRMMMTEAPQPY